MTGFGPRFGIEAGFVILVAVLAGLADLRPLLIVAVVAGAWLLVSLLELAIWRAETGSAPVATVVDPAEAGASEQDTGAPVAQLQLEDEHPEAFPAEPEGYPLRAEAGIEPAAEADSYTNILGDDRLEPIEPEGEPEAAPVERRE